MAIEVKLPSGAGVINLLRTQEPAQGSQDMEATAGAMALDVDGQCPKCKMQMGVATAVNEQVYYCDNCRVSLPLSAND